MQTHLKGSFSNASDDVAKNSTKSHFKKILAKQRDGMKKGKIWGISATTMTREKSPNVMIPKEKRFLSLDRDKYCNRKNLSLQLRTKLNKGVSFSKQKRKNNFIEKEKVLYPSSVTYFNNEEVYFHTDNPSLQRELELFEKIQTPKNELNKRKTGHKFSSCMNDRNLYLPHGRNMLYQPEVVKNNPGVGKYIIKSCKKTPSYSMRVLLSRFNSRSNLNPGPGTYSSKHTRPNTSESINQKGTFQKSNRNFLVIKNNNVTPGPGSYL